MSNPARPALPLAGLAAITLLALGLRLCGAGFGLPHLYHQDEPVMVNHALVFGSGDLNPHFFPIGSFTLYWLFGAYGVFFVLGKAMSLFATPADFARAYVIDPAPFYLVGRIVTGVFFGTLTVYLSGRFTAARYGAKAGLAAAFFLAVTLMHVLYSHYIYADIPLAAAALLFVFLLLNARDRGSAVSFAWAGVAFGWGTGIKLTMAYGLPAALVAAWVCSSGNFLDRATLKRLGFFVIAALVAYAAVSPFTFLAWGEFSAQIAQQKGTERWVGPLHHLFYSLAQGLSLPVLFLAAAGAASLWKERRRDATVILAFVVTFYAANMRGMEVMRRVLPLVPVLCVLAGIGWAWLARRLDARPLARAALFSLIAVPAVLPTIWADTILMRTDTRTQCLRWFEENVAPGTAIAVDARFYGPPLAQTVELIREKYAYLDKSAEERTDSYISHPALDQVRRQKLDLAIEAAAHRKTYNVYALSQTPEGNAHTPLFLFPLVAADPAELRSRGIRYLVFNTSDVTPAFHALKDQWAASLELVKTFSPYKVASKTVSSDPTDVAGPPNMPKELFSRDRLGPYLEVYRVNDV